MISILVWLVVLVIVFALAYWIINQLPMPAFPKQVFNIALVVILVIVVLYMVMRFVGPPPGITL